MLWLSARGEGSWAQFRNAVETLLEDPPLGLGAASSSQLPRPQWIRRDLERLGHLEFNSDHNKWRVVPPTIALLPKTHTVGVLCGARSSVRLRQLFQADGVQICKTPQDGMPPRIVVEVTTRAMRKVADQTGYIMQAEASATILSAAPSLKSRSMWTQKEPPTTIGWSVWRFSPSHMRWNQLDGIGDVHAGLFRLIMGHQVLHYFRQRGRWYEVPAQAGKYAALRQRRGVLVYDRAAKTLSCPAICRPPLLIERALVLCSGFLPSYYPSSRQVAYSSVPMDLALQTAQLLGQELT